jgi:hypothetical protein
MAVLMFYSNSLYLLTRPRISKFSDPDYELVSVHLHLATRGNFQHQNENVAADLLAFLFGILDVKGSSLGNKIGYPG